MCSLAPYCPKIPILTELSRASHAHNLHSAGGLMVGSRLSEVEVRNAQVKSRQGRFL